MLNASDPVAALAPTIDYADPVVAHGMASGAMNTADDRVLANIRSAVRRGHPQVRPAGVSGERVCLVGSGPSLNDTYEELRDLVWQGARLVTLNGAYHWCIERGLRPQAQLVMDARPSNARFLNPAVPRCNYILASQCDPAVWDVVDGRDSVWIFHAVIKKDGPTSDFLEAFYLGQWHGVGGGTTVATRAINLLRTTGIVRFDLFGIDCNWAGPVHHALPQPENDHEGSFLVTMGAQGRPETDRIFRVSPAMLKQFEDLLTIMKVNGQHFTLAAHGDGMFAYALQTLGSELDALTMSASQG